GDRAGLARTGVAVEARLPALPGRVLQGRIATVTPSVDAATQTAAALVPLGNPGGALLPGMFADVRVATGAAVRAVLVPRAAVIYDGARKLVMIARDTTFFPSAVVLGPVVGERVAVLRESGPASAWWCGAGTSCTTRAMRSPAAARRETSRSDRAPHHPVLAHP